MPLITLEVLDTNFLHAPIPKTEVSTNDQMNTKDVIEVDGGHPMSEIEEVESKVEPSEDDCDIKVSHDLSEYMMRSDGSAVCKLCGEILQSRPHWYRHKYKVHVTQTPALTPNPLFQCEQCLVFFKSKKGYTGHLASRHSELQEESNPLLTTETTASNPEQLAPPPPVPDGHARQVCDANTNTDPELAIPKSTVPNYNSVSINKPPKSSDLKKVLKTATKIDTTKVKEDLKEKRSKEEKLVSAIIDRVRRECEAQQRAGGGPARRGYSRRTTAMHT